LLVIGDSGDIKGERGLLFMFVGGWASNVMCPTVRIPLFFISHRIASEAGGPIIKDLPFSA
jgi:hypothetical protein